MATDTTAGTAAEDAWVSSQRGTVASYLQRQGIQHGEVGEWPARRLEPYLAVWA